jgi:triacylglycerol lipase
MTQPRFRDAALLPLVPVTIENKRKAMSRAVCLAVCICALGVTGCESSDAPPGWVVDVMGEAVSGPDGPVADGPSPDRGVDLPQAKGPPYPLVLAHGAFSFDKVGPLDYFYKVKPALEAEGYVVEVGILDPFNGEAVRGPKLLNTVKQVLQQTGSAKVNIIANSQGGLSARYVASQIPDQVGAVVSIGTPHQGLYIADVMLKNAPGFSITLAQAFFKAVGRPFFGDITQDTDMMACLSSMTQQGAAQFNMQYPDNPKVAMFSVSGRSNLSLGGSECVAPNAPSFISRYDKEVDPVDPLLLPTAQVIGGSLTQHEPNDGIVRVKTTKWGTWLGCIPADHFDQIGQILGDSPGIGNTFDYLTFYKDLAHFLTSQGF